MSSKLDRLFHELHELVAQSHLDAISSPDATDKDRESARKFLADNYITAAPAASKPLRALTADLPFVDASRQAEA